MSERASPEASGALGVERGDPACHFVRAFLFISDISDCFKNVPKQPRIVSQLPLGQNAFPLEPGWQHFLQPWGSLVWETKSQRCYCFSPRDLVGHRSAAPRVPLSPEDRGLSCRPFPEPSWFLWKFSPMLVAARKQQSLPTCQLPHGPQRSGMEPCESIALPGLHAGPLSTSSVTLPSREGSHSLGSPLGSPRVLPGHWNKES